MSEKLKPIEPGCMALILKGRPASNIGKVVQVKSWAPAGNSRYKGYQVESKNGGWIVEGEGVLSHAGRSTGIGLYQSNSLMRIDGHEPTEFEKLCSTLVFDK